MSIMTIDGSQGEGGGQIIRSSMALSVLSATPIHITNIRAGRKKPGLKRQHVTAVRAVADIGSKVYVVRLDAVANFPRLKPLHELSPIEQSHYSIVWNTGRCGSTLMNRSGSSRRTRCTRKMGML